MDDSGRRPTAPRASAAPPARSRSRGSARPHPGPNARRPKRRTLDDLRPLVRDGRYRIARHAVRHAAAEGFTEHDMIATLLHGRELVRYLEDERLLVLGWLPVSGSVKLPLHVVVEFSVPRLVEVITAFIPHDPHRALSRTRLAEVLRWDGHEPRAVLEGPQSGNR